MFSSLLENIQLYYEDSDPLVRPFQSIIYCCLKIYIFGSGTPSYSLAPLVR